MPTLGRCGLAVSSSTVGDGAVANWRASSSASGSEMTISRVEMVGAQRWSM